MKKPGFWVRPIAFFPSAGLLLLAVGYSIFDGKAFYRVTSLSNDWLIANFGGVFSLVGLLTVIGCAVAYFPPLGKVRIGGEQAKSSFSRLRAIISILALARNNQKYNHADKKDT
jgi:choline-glycine betaine transporter